MRNQNQKKSEPRPLSDPAAEKFFLGAALNDEAIFWDAFGKITPEMFSIARLGRIWAAMQKCADAKKPLRQSFIQLFIVNDLQEDTPLALLLSALRTDAPPSSEAEIYRDSIVHFHAKRQLLESLDRARAEIITRDIATSSEELRDLGIRALSNSFDSASDDYMMDYHSWASRVYDEVKHAGDDDSDLGGYGLEPGIPNVEQCIGRLLPGKLYVLAGMSSSGKSALARQIMENASLNAQKRGMRGVGLVSSLEMSGSEFAARHLAQELGIVASKIESGDLQKSEVARIKAHVATMRNFPLYIDSKPRMSIRDISDKCRKLKNSVGLTIAAIDHLILVAATSKNQSLMDRVSEATIESKNLAKDLGIPILMLAQLDEKRILESKSGMPNSTHLFGGQTIVQNADVIFFVHRPVVVLGKKEPDRGDAEAWDKWKAKVDAQSRHAIIFNNKRRGGEGNVRFDLEFDPPTMTFGNK